MYLGIITIPITTGLTILMLGRYIGEFGGRWITKISIVLMNMIIGYYLIQNLDINEIIEISKLMIIGIEEERLIIEVSKETILMTTLIVVITSIVLIYSIWYLNESKTFLGYLWLFASSMLILVNSKSILGLYFGWENVGIFSYILINYWYKNIQSNKSAIKAILYNKIGDIGLLSFIFIVLISFPNTTISLIKSNIPELSLIFLTLATMAKSSLFFLFPWLADAMAGPTPVSALLHAATMVTAGIYLTNRLEIIEISNINYLIGIITIVIGSIASLFQFDIKKIIAFSTASQLGYMYISSIGLSKDLSIFHLFTHGFFKALLFLIAGIIIHKCNSEQDIRRLGLTPRSSTGKIGLIIGSMSLSAIPYLSGYYSKDLIIENLLITKSILFYFLVLGSILTILYSIRLINYIYFYFPNIIYPKSSEKSPNLLILIISSIIIGYLFKELNIEKYIIGFHLYKGLVEDFRFTLPLILPLIFIPTFTFVNVRINFNSFNDYYLIIINSFRRVLFVENIINIISDLLYKLVTLYEKHIEYLFDYFTLIFYTRIVYSLTSSIKQFNFTILDLFIIILSLMLVWI